MIKIKSGPIKGYVVGVDGGGTKTIAALADSKGKIIKTAESGPSSPRNIGIEKATTNVSMAIRGVLKKRVKIIFTFIGLPCVAEEFVTKKKEIKESFKRKLPIIFRGKVEIGSDQDVAFRSGTDKKTGILIIAGTGSVIRGWKKGKQVHISGWGWLADEGSAFFVGQEVYRSIFKSLDGRGFKTLLKNMAFKKLKVKRAEDFAALIYSKNPTEIIPVLSVVCDEASKKGDRVARAIMIEAAKELIIGAGSAIKRLRMETISFPVVLVGGIFKSKLALREVKRGIRKIAPKANFILSKKIVSGAVGMAIDRI